MCCIISAKISFGEIFFLLPKCFSFSTIKKRRVIPILIARTQSGAIVNLSLACDQMRIASLKEQKRFFCPGCGGPMILKAGDVKIPHFAHHSLAECDSFSEPETPLHLAGKTLLHQFFSEKNRLSELEKFLPSIKQRADVLVENQYAVEYQCSAIPAALIQNRTEGYSSIGIKTLWIRGIGKVPEEGIGVLKLRPYEWAMLQGVAGNGYLLDYHPESNRFFYRSGFFYIRGSSWAAKTRSLPAEKQAFPFAVPKKLAAQEFAVLFTLAMKERKRFIRQQQFAKNRYQNPFWVLCYELGLDRNRLPPYIGVPIKGAEIFKTEAVIWQLHALAIQAQAQAADRFIAQGNLLSLPSGAAPLIKEYLDFAEAVKGRVHRQEEMVQLLYAIYCKNV